MVDRLVRSAVERERQAEIAVGGGEVRVEVECALKFLDRLVGPPHQEGDIAEREMRPRVAVVEFRRPGSERRCLLHLRLRESSNRHSPTPTT